MRYECAKIVRSRSVAARKIADEVLLVPVTGSTAEVGAIYVLNEVAARVWELIEAGTDFPAIRDAIIEEFDVESTQAGEDLSELIDDLARVGAIEVTVDAVP